jgi:hypothetical protein
MFMPIGMGRLNDSSALNQPDNNDDDGDDEQDMDKSSQGHRRNHAEQPQNYENYCDRP